MRTIKATRRALVKGERLEGKCPLDGQRIVLQYDERQGRFVVEEGCEHYGRVTCSSGHYWIEWHFTPEEMKA